MASKFFTKAASNQAFLKVGLYGKAGTGKTLTSLLFAEGLAARDGKRVAYIDTERGTEFYSLDIAERKVHPKAFDFDRLITRSIMETVEAVESIDPAEHSVVVIDSITHLWEAAIAAYGGKKMSNGGIPIQAWGAIKKPYKKLMTLLLDGNFHALICGREGVSMEEDADGETHVTGSKMKAEGETPHEPHILGRMRPERDAEGGYIIKAFFEKDRSGILSGRTIEWPNYGTIAPVVNYLNGTTQGKLGSEEEIAERDAAAQETQAQKVASERESLFAQILTAITNAKSVGELRTAWDLTKGKKTKLGEELMAKLETAKEAKKADMMRLSEVA